MLSKDELRAECLRLLNAGAIDAAVDAVLANELASNRPGGINVPWHSVEYQARFRREAHLLFEIIPGILREIDECDLRDIRVRAGLMYLLGLGRIPKYMRLPNPTVGNMGADATARMLIFRVRHDREVAQARALGVTRFEVQPAPDCCDICAGLAGEYDDPPELPHSSCVHEYGCRCIAFPILD